jgi:non-heme chloroperoxidase
MSSEPVKLHIDDTGGTGRPVVLIHGWPLAADAWSEQIGPLRDAGHRVISYDRRGFSRSEKPPNGYDYDALADDLDQVIHSLDLHDVTLVGFSMGGGEVARYASRHGMDRIHSVVFAAAVPPYLMQSSDNPDGPLDEETFQGLRGSLEEDRDSFFEDFTTGFFSAGEELTVSEEQRQEAVQMAHQSDQTAALACMDAWAYTDFRSDLDAVTVPALVIHGDSDAIVPFEGSGKRTHEALADSELALVKGAPHGLNVSHVTEFNAALIPFLAR